jgi:hypothetical protein
MAVKRVEVKRAKKINRIRFDAFDEAGGYKFNFTIIGGKDDRQSLKIAINTAKRYNYSDDFPWMAGNGRIYYVSPEGSKMIYSIKMHLGNHTRVDFKDVPEKKEYKKKEK